MALTEREKMNYYSDQEIEQVIEEPDRRPVPASSHVALTTGRRATPRKDRTGLKFGLFVLGAFLFVLLANIVELPGTMLALFAGILIGVFVGITMNWGSGVRRR